MSNFDSMKRQIINKTADTPINPKDYKLCLRYIEKYWKEITCHIPNDQYIHLGLPNKFISPNKGIYKNDQFYWDSYFIILGLVHCNRTQLAKGMIDNMLYLQKRFKIIPMRNRFYNLGSSQVPFLTSMAREVYYELENLRWFKTVMHSAEKELEEYWMNKNLTEIHIVFEGLSRYCDHYITHLAAEHESGWDMTSRFHNHCLDYLPVDLNCALYKYETDLSSFYKETGNRRKSNFYILQSEKRRRKMNSLMWNFKKGFYFDYDYKHKKQSTFYSVAGFYPLWAKLATHTQAKKIVDNLYRLEYDGGIANTQSNGLSAEYKQHDYPNGWPHQQWIVVKGLLNYGFRNDAMRIAKKYLDLNKKVFETTGKLWEKYDVVKCDIGKSERYMTQSGFGWTNAVFVRLLHEFA
jgi:alpha,alpha-trehalase